LFILLGLTRATAADIAANGDPSWLAASRIAQQSQESGDLASAERLWRDALRSAREELGENHKQIAALLSNLGAFFISRDVTGKPIRSPDTHSWWRKLRAKPKV